MEAQQFKFIYKSYLSTKKPDGKRNGFTFLELIITIFVITVGIVATFIIAQHPLSYTSLSVQKLTAAYLVQEGIEIVRNIRDTNWVQGENWDAGLSDGEWEADYTTTTFVGTAYDNCEEDYNCREYAGNYLKFDGNFYNYSSGDKTKFTRKITIAHQPNDILEVVVRVSWREKGKSYHLEAQENLYRWYQ